MSLNYVVLTVDVYDGQGNVPTSGTATFTPSATLTDTTNHEIVSQAPIVVSFKPTGPPLVRLLATDNGTLAPSGWGWAVAFTGNGLPAGFNFFLLFGSGASQNLSSLNPVSSVVTMAAYLPIDYPTGAAAGYVWTSDADGNGSWQAASGGGGGGFANPMTTLGDIIFENASPAAARLAGNATSTKKYLNQTGTGSVSAAPAWGTIAAADLPTGTTSTQGALQLDGTTGDIAASPATAAAGATGKAADAAHVHPQPPVFAPTGAAGAVQASRYVGATTTGSPTGNPFLLGDYVVDQSGAVWVCISAGTPGTWSKIGHLSVTAGDFQPLGSAAAGSSGKAADAGHIHPTTGVVLSSSLPLAIGSGGTGQATQQAALDAIAGAVTSGDYLRGNGSHVSMSAIAAADLPTATTGTQGAVIVDGTATDIQPAGVQAAGAKGQAADAKHVHPYQAWQFLPEAYGAAGDGKVITDLALNSNTTATSATAGFTSGDTGKHIMINGGAGTAAGPLVTTITFVNSTTITLANAASVTGTGYQAVYGTDDTSAINSALAAAKTYALANGYFAEILFAAKIYVLSAAPTQATSPQTNAQIVIPWPAVNGTSQKLVIALTGAGDAGFYEYWESTTPNLAGSVLVSMQTAPSTPSGTFGQQSVIGGPSAGGAFTGTFANTKVSVRGLQVVCGAYTNQYAYDFGYLSAMRIEKSSAHIFAPSGVNAGKSPLLKDLPSDTGFQATIGAGLRSPVAGNNADVTAADFTVEGYARALYVWDHFVGTGIRTIYNDVVLTVDTAQGVSGTNHTITILPLGCEVYNGGLHSIGSGAYIPVYITMDAECTGVTYDVSDVGNVFYGEVHWTDPADARSPTVTGAANLKIINDKMGPGPWSGAPSVPASTTAQQNTAWRDAAVTIVGGNVTAIAVGGTATGATFGTFIVPSGATITLTYSSAPTWTWVLL